jgi:fluoroacetyl-CoA thioesterase
MAPDRLEGGPRAAYRTGVPIETGLLGRVNFTVTDDDTALSFRSGEVPVLATPRLIAACEEASCRATQGLLKEGTTTVGRRIQFDHLAPSGVGAQVTVEAMLERVEGRRLTFTVSASDATGLIGAGKVSRVLVEVEPFLSRSR